MRSPATQRGYPGFVRRMAGLRAHLDALRVHYYPEPDLGWGQAQGGQ